MLDVAFRVGRAKRRVFDALTLFRYRGLQTRERVQEGLHLWADNRSRHFARARISPQVDAMEAGARILSRLDHELEAAYGSASEAEEAHRDAVHALASAEREHEVAVRRAEAADRSVGAALGEARAAVGEGRNVQEGIRALGSPPPV